MKILIDDYRCIIKGAGNDVIVGVSYIIKQVLDKGKSGQSNAEVLALICEGAVNCDEKVKFDWDIFLKELRKYGMERTINDEQNKN